MNWDEVRRYATPGVILSAIALGVILIISLVVWFFFFRPLPQSDSDTFLAALTIIPGPSSTPPAPTATARPTSTATATFSPLQLGVMGIGAYVQVVGTEGTGLNIRSGPGLSNPVEFLAFDAEVFEVRDGPTEVDGFEWWYIVTPVDDGRAGWAAADFLEVVANQ